MVIISLLALDFLVEASGLAQTELLTQPSGTRIPETPEIISLTPIWILIHTLLDQSFFFGFICQSYFRRYNPYLVIYLAGLIFAGAHASFSISTFTIGLIGASLYFITGTLTASFLFQIFSHLAGYLLETVYSRLITVFGFLF